MFIIRFIISFVFAIFSFEVLGSQNPFKSKVISFQETEPSVVKAQIVLPLGLSKIKTAIGSKGKSLQSPSEKEKDQLLDNMFSKYNLSPGSTGTAFLRFCLHEQKHNTPKFRKSNRVYEVNSVLVDKSKVNFDLSEDFSEGILKQLIRKKSGEEKVLVPIHPFNTDQSVAGYEELQTAKKFSHEKKRRKIKKMRMKATASRSMIVTPKNRKRKNEEARKEKAEVTPTPFGIKMGTNYVVSPSNLDRWKQNDKVKMGDEGEGAREVSEYIKGIDELLGKHDDCNFLHEIGFVSLKKNSQGYIVRDLSPILQSGFECIPGFSLPYVGREIARYSKMNFRDFGNKHLAKALGRAKAIILLRYQLQMVTPNTQNYLIKFDANFKTSHIIFRDLSDFFLVRPVAKIVQDLLRNYVPRLRGRYGNSKFASHKFIHPYSSNSTWKFNEGERPISYEIIKFWRKEHIESYLKTINKELGVNIMDEFFTEKAKNYYDSKFKIPYLESDYDRGDFKINAAIQAFFMSEKGQDIYRAYYKKLIEDYTKSKIKDSPIEKKMRLTTNAANE